MPELSELIVSEDGSHTVVHPMYQVTYHSRRGAIQESNTVFIEACLEARYSQIQNLHRELRIFEMGFGTGLNAFLTMCWAKQKKQKTCYTGVDIYLLSPEIYSMLNYSSLIGNTEEWHFLCSTEWNHRHQCGEFFSFEKNLTNLEDCTYEEEFDFIFYDAFAPSSQPEVSMLPSAYSHSCSQEAFAPHIVPRGNSGEIFRRPDLLWKGCLDL